jgi:hypothetical protein
MLPAPLAALCDEIAARLNDHARDAPVDPAVPAEVPSTFGPLRMPRAGQSPEAVLLAAHGVPTDLISELWAMRGDPGYFAAIVALGARVGARAPRLLRQLAWLALRESPERAPALVDAVVAGDLAAPGAVALLCDLAEESPSALAPHWEHLFEALLREDVRDPTEGAHHLSDVFCFAAPPRELITRRIAGAWASATNRRARSVLLRLSVFEGAVALTTMSGKFSERVHRAKTRYQAYAYHFYSDGHDWRVVDLTRDLQQNLSDLPKYAPSMYLRRFVGKRVELTAIADRAADDPTLLVRSIHDADAPAATAPPPGQRSREPAQRPESD